MNPLSFFSSLAEPQRLYFLLLPAAALLLALFWWKERGTQRRLRLGSYGTFLEEQNRRTRRHHFVLLSLLVLATLLIGIAAARPLHIRSWAKRYSEGIDILICLDLSESMEATDLVPTRLVAAKSVIREFIEKRKDDRIGIVTFGGEAVTRAPLTKDHDFLLAQVEALQLRELKQGTAIGNGLANSIGRLRHSESKSKVIVLLTDGDNNVGAVNPITAANLARQEGIKIYAIGMGKEDRVVVPIYAYDMYGKKTQLVAQVPSYINPELLRKIADLTGGLAYMARDTMALSQVLQAIDRFERTKVRLKPMQKKEELFIYPTAAALLILIAIYLLLDTRFRRINLKKVVPTAKGKEGADAVAV